MLFIDNPITTSVKVNTGTKIEPQIRLSGTGVGTMTTHTMLCQNRSNIAIKINWLNLRFVTPAGSRTTQDHSEHPYQGNSQRPVTGTAAANVFRLQTWVGQAWIHA
jgi:hypothetical protein